MIDQYPNLIRLIVGLVFHTVVSVIDGLLMADNHTKIYHLVHEIFVTLKSMHNINSDLIQLSSTIFTIILGRGSSSLLILHCQYPYIGR